MNAQLSQVPAVPPLNESNRLQVSTLNGADVLFFGGRMFTASQLRAAVALATMAARHDLTVAEWEMNDDECKAMCLHVDDLVIQYTGEA